MKVSESTAISLAHSLQDLQRILKCVASTSAKTDGHGMATRGVLTLINEVGDAKAVELAQRMGVGQSVLSRHLSDLESKGLIERVTDPKDRRVQHLQLSPLGRNVLAESAGRRVQSLRQALGEWEETEASAAVEILNKLGTSLNEFIRPKATGKETQNTLAGAK